jgi:o-succinylbenzoate synthase
MNPDVIQDVEAWIVKVPFKKTWKISLYESKDREHAIVCLTSAEGFKGYGEVCPAPALMGEDTQCICDVILRLLQPILLGANPFDIELIHARMDQIIKSNNVAKACVDIALHDLQGKMLGIPLYLMLGGRFRQDVPLTYVLGIQETEKTLEEVEKYRESGITSFKVKIGINPTEEIALLKAMRNRFGDDIHIRVDANQAFSVAQALKILRRMEEFNLEFIEQPLPWWDLEGMQYLTSAIDTPIMADESVFSLADALRVVRMRAADLINIKVSKVGGIHCARKIAVVAQSANMPVSIGSNLDLGIGSAANLHLSVSTPNLPYPNESLLGPVLHEYDLIETPFPVKNGMAKPSDAPGLGIELNSRARKQV